MAEVDLRDGVADGKNARVGPRPCSDCNRNNSRRHEHCIYCGHFLGRGPFG